ncbi:MAG: acetate/propionate family kinase [Actinomycetia bacterium]|nr:acetate/propionate family kinase [Actinomycetes bacterium]
MRVLVLNVGSSSLKFDVYNTEIDLSELKGDIQHITTDALMKLSHDNTVSDVPLAITSHREAIPIINELIEEYGLDYEAIGFRIVHGGDLAHHEIVTDEMIEKVKEFSPLAPLHNPIAMEVVELFREQTDKPIALIFDTVFYNTLPATSYTYSVPEQWREMGIRKYGFHGLSHDYLYRRVNELTDAPRVISCHLGAGSSITATTREGALDTSMGFSPLAGVMMGTRTGDIDPAVVEFLANNTDLTLAQITRTLNSKSGFLAMTGTADVAEICVRAIEGDAQAQLAIDLFDKRIVDYIAQYYVEMGGVDALVFAGGIGENCPLIRHNIVEMLAPLGFTLDEQANEANVFDEPINGPSGPAIYVLQTNESVIIAQGTEELVSERESVIES